MNRYAIKHSPLLVVLPFTGDARGGRSSASPERRVVRQKRGNKLGERARQNIAKP